MLFHSLAMLTTSPSEYLIARVNDLAKASLSFLGKYLLLPNLALFVNILLQLERFNSVESDDIILSIRKPHCASKSSQDCFNLKLNFSIKDLIADVHLLKELLLSCLCELAKCEVNGI